MHITRLAGVCLSSLAVLGASDCERGPDSPVTIGIVVEGAVAPQMASGKGVGMVVGVISGDEQLIYTFGEKKLESGKAPTKKTLFQIGSVSKTFTGTLLALFDDRGEVSLSDTLNSYLPSQYRFSEDSDKGKITLEQLAVHTSGLPRNPTDVPSGADFYYVDRVYENVAAVSLDFEPGRSSQYSNFAFSLLGFALAEHKGKNWRKLVEKNLTDPLDMPDTRVYGDLTIEQYDRVATGYGCSTDLCALPPERFLSTFPTPGLNPGGGLYSTGSDMLKWLEYNMGLSSDDAELSGILPAIRKKRYGNTTLGWGVSSLDVLGVNRSLISKDGATEGFRAWIGYVPSLERGVFVLANFDADPAKVGSLILSELP